MDSGPRLIRYRCALPSHQRAANGKVADTLTVYGGAWAFCPYDARAKAHEWAPVDEVSLETLMRLGAAIDPTRQPQPQPQLEPAGASRPAAKRKGSRPKRKI